MFRVLRVLGLLGFRALRLLGFRVTAYNLPITFQKAKALMQWADATFPGTTLLGPGNNPKQQSMKGGSVLCEE